MIKFRQKDFSNYILGDALKGAGIGLAIGSGTAKFGFIPEKISSKIPGSKWYNNKFKTGKAPYQTFKDGKSNGWARWDFNELKKKFDMNPDGTFGPPEAKGDLSRMNQQKRAEVEDKMRRWEASGRPQDGDLKQGNTAPGATPDQKLIFTAATTILGAALGAVVGAIRTGILKHSQRNTNQRLLKQLLPRLRSMGLEEGKDYTMDPKKANEIPTKVCIVLCSASGELQTVINSKDDPKLKKVVEKIARKSSGRVRTTTQNNKFNEITISTEKNTAANVNQVVSIIESFVENGYPVYIVEVG